MTKLRLGFKCGPTLFSALTGRTPQCKNDRVPDKMMDNEKDQARLMQARAGQGLKFNRWQMGSGYARYSAPLRCRSGLKRNQ